MNYMGTLRYLVNIEHKLFSSISDSRFVQTNELPVIYSWYSSIQSKGNHTQPHKEVSFQAKQPQPHKVVASFQAKQPQPHKVVVTTIYHKSVHELFFMLIDPLCRKDEMITRFNELIDSNMYLLKEITPHYKKLCLNINTYMSSKSQCDTSYSNSKYMLFWSNLMNSNIYVVNGKSYKAYHPLDVSQKDIIFKIHDDKFEYINMNFEQYAIHNQPIYPSIDITRLNTYTIPQLKNLCLQCKLDFQPNIKKACIISLLYEVLI